MKKWLSDELKKRTKLHRYEEEYLPRVAEKYRSHRWNKVTLEAGWILTINVEDQGGRHGQLAKIWFNCLFCGGA